MHMPRSSVFLFAASVTLGILAGSAAAAGPRNPYSSFNLSGINYGAQQWDRDQRAGRVVWPYYNTPSRASYRNSTVGPGVVTAAGGMMRSGGYRAATRTVRRWRR